MDRLFYDVLIRECVLAIANVTFAPDTSPTIQCQLKLSFFVIPRSSHCLFSPSKIPPLVFFHSFQLCPSSTLTPFSGNLLFQLPHHQQALKNASFRLIRCEKSWWGGFDFCFWLGTSPPNRSYSLIVLFWIFLYCFSSLLIIAFTVFCPLLPHAWILPLIPKLIAFFSFSFHQFYNITYSM